LAQILHATQRQRGAAATEYELIASRSSMRMQVVCTKCGRVQDIQDKAIAHLLQERKYSNFTMQYASVFVYGECKICRRRKDKKTD
jgi:Fe2+ or Zn2+ uptake regulation protein